MASGYRHTRESTELIRIAQAHAHSAPQLRAAAEAFNRALVLGCLTSSIALGTQLEPCGTSSLQPGTEQQHAAQARRRRAGIVHKHITATLRQQACSTILKKRREAPTRPSTPSSARSISLYPKAEQQRMYAEELDGQLQEKAERDAAVRVRQMDPDMPCTRPHAPRDGCSRLPCTHAFDLSPSSFSSGIERKRWTTLGIVLGQR